MRVKDKGAARSQTEDRVLAILKEYGPMRASYVGDRLWQERRDAGRLYGRNLPQRFARAAGKVLQAMKRRKLVWQSNDLKWNWGAHAMDTPAKSSQVICPDCNNKLVPVRKRQGMSGIPLVIEMCKCGSKKPPVHKMVKRLKTTVTIRNERAKG